MPPSDKMITLDLHRLNVADIARENGQDAVALPM
jgi:hypothetical protein